MIFMRTFVLVLFCGAVVGQAPKSERKPVHGPGALEALREAYAKVYRPREHGLQGVRFRVRSEVETGGKKSVFGPWTVTWHAQGPVVILDAAGQPAKLERGFALRMIRDVIGDRGSMETERNHLTLVDEKNIEVRLPDWVPGESLVRRSLLVRDEKGRLQERRLFALGNDVASSVRFEWIAHGKQWMVKSKTTKAADTVHVVTYTRKALGGHLLPTIITANARRGEELAKETITYDGYELNPPLPKVPEEKKPESGGR